MRGRSNRLLFVVGALAVVGAVDGCAVSHSPVVVLGDTTPLAGVWEGTYESRDTGRRGDLYLALSADGDSAVGEVVMDPRGGEITVRRDGASWQWEGVPRAQVLPIRFVRVGSGALGASVEVIGELEPYHDPNCGCALRTTFRGEIEGDVATGTFASEAENPFHDAEGTWSARRRPDR